MHNGNDFVMTLPPDTDLTNHAIPGPIDLLPMLAIGHQVKVIGELHRLRNFLQDVNTEALAAFFDVAWLFICFIPTQLQEETNKQSKTLCRKEKLLFH